jgi:hypothetical protein
VEVVASGRFHTYAVSNMHVAVEILMSRPSGERRPDRRYPVDSVNAAVLNRLHEMNDPLPALETARTYGVPVYGTMAHSYVQAHDDEAAADDFAIGTRLGTSADGSYLDCAYKLQEYAGCARRKRPTGKATWPGRKQVYRRVDPDGRVVGDIVTFEDDLQDGEPLLHPVMRAGRRLDSSPSPSMTWPPRWSCGPPHHDCPRPRESPRYLPALASRGKF